MKINERRNDKISLIDFYNFLIENKENCDIIHCDNFSKRYWIMDIYKHRFDINGPIINLYMEYETTTLIGPRDVVILREEMLNELSPLMRRYKINKILKNGI